MPEPFEDPDKTELRERTLIAIDDAAQDLVEPPITLAFPAGSKLRGKVKGDVQSVDGDGHHFFFYLRIGGDAAIPGWIANIASASHNLDNCQVYIVATETSTLLEQSCRANGAGLLRITEENTFEHLIDYSELDPAQNHQDFALRAGDVRRRLERKLSTQLESLNGNYHKTEELTSGMTSKKRDEYVKGVEDAIERWDTWGAHVSSKLDEAAALDSGEMLAYVEELIAAGAINDDNIDNEE
jgi:hypothetical protein